MKEKPTVRSPFVGAFPSDCIPKPTKHVSVHFFIRNNNSCNRNAYQVSLLGGWGLKLARTKV